MEYVLKFLYDFILIYLIALIVYLVFVNKRRKDYLNLKDGSYVKLFIARYNLDMRKTKYEKVLKIVAYINSFIIAFASTLILYIDSFLWKIVVCFVVVFTLIYALYEIAGRHLKNKEGKK